MTERKLPGSSGLRLVRGNGHIALKRFLSRGKILVSSAVILLGVTAVVCSAQIVTSAHSGTLYYFEGDVSVDGAPVQSNTGRFKEMKEQSVLCTGRGRAEVLLTPGVFLRIGESSVIRMLDNRLVSTRIEILSGNVIVESEDSLMSVKDSPVTLIYRDYAIQLAKYGLVQIGLAPAHMKVYEGEALVSTANDRATVRKGRQLSLSAAILAERFNDRVGDDLYLWARNRSESISAANILAVRSLNSSGHGNRDSSSYESGYTADSGGLNDGWYFRPLVSRGPSTRVSLHADR
jgi:hypothetical protein